MKIMVESFKRLYEAGKLTKAQIEERAVSGKITDEEYTYITGEERTAE